MTDRGAARGARTKKPAPRNRPTVLGRIRRGLDAVAHPWRRRQALARLRTEAQPGVVLFVCHGNVCRSPFAEVVFRREINGVSAGVLDTTSAGFIGPDRGSPPEAIAAAARVGIDLTAHRSKMLSTELVRASSLVVVMSADQARAIRGRYAATNPQVVILGDLDPMPISERTIVDPWKLPDEVFDASYARIHRCVRVLAELMMASS